MSSYLLALFIILVDLMMTCVKVSKSRKQFIYGLLNSHKKRTKLTILSIFFTQDSEFCSFLGIIEKTIICLGDFLTFSCLNLRMRLCTRILLNQLSATKTNV